MRVLYSWYEEVSSSIVPLKSNFAKEGYTSVVFKD